MKQLKIPISEVLQPGGDRKYCKSYRNAGRVSVLQRMCCAVGLRWTSQTTQQAAGSDAGDAAPALRRSNRMV